MFNKFKSLPHTGDLQTKAYQGHYLKHKEIVEFRNISLIDTVHFGWYDYRDYIFNKIKSLPHTGDLQTKVFQGHYLKHKEIVEFRNISLIDTVHFVWYDYKDYMFNNIKSLPHTGDLEKPWFGGHRYEEVTWYCWTCSPYSHIIQNEQYLWEKCFVILQVPYVWGSDLEKPWFGGHKYENFFFHIASIWQLNFEQNLKILA